jgi:hypothetical protein
VTAPDWEKIARACRRYLDCHSDRTADDIALGSVTNDLRNVVEREIAKLQRVWREGDTEPEGVNHVKGKSGRHWCRLPGKNAIDPWSPLDAPGPYLSWPGLLEMDGPITEDRDG